MKKPSISWWLKKDWRQRTTIAVLRRRVRQNYFNEQGEITDSLEFAPWSGIVGMSVPVGQWHALESLESGSVILETKDGAYAPITPKDVLSV